MNVPGRRPRVVVHVAVALDGATTGFPADVARFYELAATWHEDVTLGGADTVLAQETALRSAPKPGPAADGPLAAVIDSRARVAEWQALLASGYWSEVIAFRSQATPPHPDPGVPEIVAGRDRVDLVSALRVLADRGAQVVRVDSGGALNGALLDEGLVDEVSLLVHPCLSDGTGHRWVGRSCARADRKLRLTSCETFDELVWLRYSIP